VATASQGNHKEDKQRLSCDSQRELKGETVRQLGMCLRQNETLT